MAKYMRVWAEWEIEIVDPTAARAKNFDWSRDETGEPVMLHDEDDELAAARALHAIVFEALQQHGDAAGVKMHGGTLLPRPRVGDVYPEWPLPEIPARRDDGTYPEDAG